MVRKYNTKLLKITICQNKKQERRRGQLQKIYLKKDDIFFAPNFQKIAFFVQALDIEKSIQGFGEIYTEMTGLKVEDHDMRGHVGGVNIPTLMVQVRNDMNSRASDIQEMYDKLAVEDKEMIWIEDTEWRFKGYTYFSEKPEEMVAWYDAH